MEPSPAAGAMPSVLSEVVISRIKPSSKTEHPGVLYPCIFDLLNVDFYIPLVLFYRLDSTNLCSYTDFVHKLKESLSKVLVPFYPMAGKWIVAEDVSVRNLVCDDEGVIFVEAAIDDEIDKVVNFHDFQASSVLTGEFAVPGFEPRRSSKSTDSKEYPSLIVQVTRFKCGGVCLGLNFNHMTTDGCAFSLFVEAWAEVSATGSTTISPCHDRSLAPSLLDQAHILEISPETKNLDDVLGMSLKAEFFDIPPLSRKLLPLKKAVIDELKKRADESETSESQLSSPLSTFECISAVLWRCIARIPSSADGMSISDPVLLAFSIEGRKRWSDPPLPETFFGNVQLLTALRLVTGSELSKESFMSAASEIHRTVKSVTPETSVELLNRHLQMIQDYRSRKLLTETDEAEKSSEPPITVRFVIASSWLRFCFYNLAFGSAKPFFFDTNEVWSSLVMGYTTIEPAAPESEYSAVLKIGFTPEAMKVLLDDPEFLHLIS